MSNVHVQMLRNYYCSKGAERIVETTKMTTDQTEKKEDEGTKQREEKCEGSSSGREKEHKTHLEEG